MTASDMDRILDEAFRAVVGNPCRPVGPLTRQEIGEDRKASVRAMLADGWKFEAIAAALGITRQSVAYHAKTIRNKK